MAQEEWPRGDAVSSVTATNGKMALSFGNYVLGDEHSTTFGGWIEDDKKTWIIFLDSDLRPAVFYAARDPETGAVIGEAQELIS